MKTIWKYNLSIRNFQTIQLPENAVILSVAEQHGEVCLWAMVDPEKPLEERDIEIFGTGHPIPVDMGVERNFLGTVVTYRRDPYDPGLSKSLVWHIFERIS